MSDGDFVQLVSRMRQAQKAYFRERLAADLAESRRLEREVDRALAMRYAPKAEPSLFDREDATR